MPRKPEPRKVTITRYALPDGTRCKKGTPGAIRTVEESETYYVNLDGDRISLKTTDLATAWVNLRAELRRRELRRQGITDEYTDHAARPIEEHRDAWIQAVTDSGAGADHVKLLVSHVATLCRLCNWKRIPDVTAETCLAALARLQRVDGLSAQTRNHYLRHVKQFTRWLADTDRLVRDPLRALKMIAVDADRRHFHRCPTTEEMKLLFDYLESGSAHANKGTAGRGPRQRLADGRQRALAYKVGMATGFRANELRNLTKEGFDLDGAQVTCRPGYSKRRKKDTQPLPPWLVAELRAWFDAGESWERLPGRAGEMLQADLAAAGVKYATGEGEFTMHSLRVYYITQLASQPGISPKTLFDLARHSDPKLTLKVYAKGEAAARRQAVEGIGSPNPLTGSDATSPGAGDQ